MKLPAASTTRGLVMAAAATVLACALMYYVPQHWHRGEPVLLPMTAVDRGVPFWPLSGLVYFAVFPFLLATFVALRDPLRASRFLYACLLAQSIGMLCFLLWPTAYPRDQYPLPVDAGALASAMVRFCRSSDAAVNCLPSLHVSTVALCLAALWRSRWFVPALLVGIPVMASTLTFKQHYAADVFTGVALGLASWAVCLRLRLRQSGLHRPG